MGKSALDNDLWFRKIVRMKLIATKKYIKRKIIEWGQNFILAYSVPTLTPRKPPQILRSGKLKLCFPNALTARFLHGIQILLSG